MELGQAFCSAEENAKAAQRHGLAHPPALLPGGVGGKAIGSRYCRMHLPAVTAELVKVLHWQWDDDRIHGIKADTLAAGGRNNPDRHGLTCTALDGRRVVHSTVDNTLCKGINA